METLIDLVRDGAERFDRRPALLIRPFFRTRTWRYRDLATTVPRAARVLSDAGLAEGDRVILADTGVVKEALPVVTYRAEPSASRGGTHP